MPRFSPSWIQRVRAHNAGMKVCFSAIPAYGRVFPMVPLAAAAGQAGHQVSFAASNDFQQRLPVPVLQGVPEGMTLHQAAAEARAETRDRSDPMAWPKAMFGGVMHRHVVPRLLDHWKHVGPPDLVIPKPSIPADSSPPAPTSAGRTQEAGVEPAANLAPGPSRTPAPETRRSPISKRSAHPSRQTP